MLVDKPSMTGQRFKHASRRRKMPSKEQFKPSIKLMIVEEQPKISKIIKSSMSNVN
jgi:hypothetical protein